MDTSFASTTSFEDITSSQDLTSSQNFTSASDFTSHPESTFAQDIGSSCVALAEMLSHVPVHTTHCHVLSCKGYIQNSSTTAWSVPLWYIAEEACECVIVSSDASQPLHLGAIEDEKQPGVDCAVPRSSEKLEHEVAHEYEPKRSGTETPISPSKVNTPVLVPRQSPAAEGAQHSPDIIPPPSFARVDTPFFSPISKKIRLVREDATLSANIAEEEHQVMLHKEVHEDLKQMKLHLGMRTSPFWVEVDEEINLMLKEVEQELEDAKAKEGQHGVIFTVFMLAVIASIYLAIE